MNKILNFIKSEVVLLVSFLLAVASMFFVAPDRNYLDYIDFRTLSLLFCLMTVMAGFNKLGLFRQFAEKLLNRAKTVRGVVLTLVLLCFFSSMIITNDVALITFVPFTIITLKLADQSKKLIFTIVLETIAANLGSMLTPIGNPQNLYLFSAFDMQISDFISTIFPYALLSLILLIIPSILAGKESVSIINTEQNHKVNNKLMIVYSLLFFLALLGVFRVINYIVLFAIVLIVVLIFDCKIIIKVDYSLLFTFVFLFIFIGNLGNIQHIINLLSATVKDNEVVIGVIASQVFSNVPTTLLLSEFTSNYKALLIGVNLGGLGTLIASMASLISFKFIQKEDVSTAKYFVVFTALNIVFLALNLALYFVIAS